MGSAARGLDLDSYINVLRWDSLEALGVLGFIFGLAAMATVVLWESRLKKAGVLPEDTTSE